MYYRLCLLLVTLFLSLSLASAESPSVPYNVVEEISFPKPEYHTLRELSMSSDSRYIAYTIASNSGDYVTSLYVYDRQNGTTINFEDEVQTYNWNTYPIFSSNGQYITFTSSESLEQGAVYGYAFDLQTGDHVQIFLGLDGETLQNDPGGILVTDISADGRYIAYTASTKNAFDGKYPTCTSPDPEPFTYACNAIFVYDQMTGITERISINANGELGDGDSFGAYISGDGRYVLYESGAKNLIENNTECATEQFCFRLYLYDRVNKTTRQILPEIEGQSVSRILVPFFMDLSQNGMRIVFTAHFNTPDYDDQIYSYEVETEITKQVSVSTLGTRPDKWSLFAGMSPDARYVLFTNDDQRALTDDPNACDPSENFECGPVLFLRDQFSQTTYLVSQKDGKVFGVPQTQPYHSVSASGDQIIMMGSVGGVADISIAAPINVTLPRPSNVTLTVINSTQIDVNWADNTNGAAVYQIERSLNGATEWTALNTTPTGVTTYTDNNPPCGTVYYRLRAFDTTNNVYSPYSFNVNAKVCEIPATSTPTQTATSPEATLAPSTPTSTATASPSTPTSETSEELIINGGFEDSGDTSRTALHWKGKGLENDKRVQNKPDKQVAHSGNYAFQFRAGLPSKITQTIVSPAGESGQFLNLSAWVEGKNLSGAKVQAKVIYSDQPAQKLALDSAALNAGSYPYKLLSAEGRLNGTVTTIKVQISQKNGKGRLRIDDVSLTLSATSTQLLPLP